MVSSIIDGLRRAGLVLLLGGFAGMAVYASSKGGLQVQTWAPEAIVNSILIGVLYGALLDATVRLVRLLAEAFLPLQSDRDVLYHALAPAAGTLCVFAGLTAGLKVGLETFPPSWPLLLGVGSLAAVVAGCVSGVLAMREYYRRDHQDHAEGWEARMRRLRTQTCPPVLFNTLNAVPPLLEEAPEEAGLLFERLEALLRYRHEAASKGLVPLADEIEAALWYMELMQLQYGDDVEVGFDVPESLFSLRVPRLSLLPLLENAVQHGALPTDEPCTITVTGRYDDAQLCLAVLDTGPGFDTTNPGTVLRRGSGIADLYARLCEHFGGAAELSLLPQGVLWCVPVAENTTVASPAQEESPLPPSPSETD